MSSESSQSQGSEAASNIAGAVVQGAATSVITGGGAVAGAVAGGIGQAIFELVRPSTAK